MTTPHPQAEELKNKGNAALSAQNYDEAIKLYTQAIALDASNHVYYSNRSAAYASIGKYNDALADAERAVSLSPNWAKGYQRKGFALHYLKKHKESVEAYETALKFEPNSAQIQSGLSDAKAALKKELSNTPKPESGATMLKSIQDIFVNMGDPVVKCKSMPETAHLADDNEFLKMLRDVRTNPDTLVSYLGDERMKTFVSVALQYMTFSQMSPEERAEMARQQEETRMRVEKAEQEERDRRRKQEQAKKDEEERKRKEEEDSKLTDEQKQARKLKEEGNALYSQKKFAEALAIYQKASDLDPTNPIYFNNIAAVYLEQKEYEKCITTCEKAVEVGRSQRAPLDIIARALSRIGNAYLKQNQFDKAIEYYKKAQIEHRDKTTLASLLKAEKLLKEKTEQDYYNPELSAQAKEEGNALFKLAKFPEAVDKYTEAIKRNPKDPLPYSNRATAYTKLGALPEALKDCEKAIELDPKFIKAYLKKGNVHYLMKEYQKAFKVYEQARKYDPDNAEIADAEAKTMAAVSKGQDLESTKRNIQNDPELQTILSDPLMQQVLKDLQTNPASLTGYLKDPVIQENIKKLMAAGVIGTR